MAQSKGPGETSTVRRLFELVTQKKTDGPLSADSPQPPELALLFAQCGDLSELLAVSCSQALVQLAVLGHVQPGVVLTGLLNALPTAKSLVGIVGALCDLMVSQLIATTESSQPYICPYSIRARQHPLVTVVTQRPDSWPVLLRQVTRILRWPHPSVQQEAVALLCPFLRFVLLEPPNSPQFIQLRLSLPRTLLSSTKVKDTQFKVIEFLEDVVSGIQVQTAAQVGEALALLDQVSGAVLSTRGHKGLEAMRGRLAVHCLALARTAAPLGVDTEGLIETTARLVKAGVKSCCVARIWLLTAELLLHVPDRHVSYLLTIVSLLLSMHPAALPRPLLALMVLPLAHVTSTPPGVGSGSLAGRAARLLREVCACCQHPAEGTGHVEKPSSSLCVTPEGAAVDVYLHLAADLDRKCPAPSEWLDGLQVALGGASAVPAPVTLLVGGVCVWGAERGLLERALGVLTTICTLHPEQAPDLLPLFIFCLGYHDDPRLRLVFLEAMPKVATHKVSVAPTLKTLQLLGEAGALRPVALRLVTALWKRQDRCFPYLQRMLQAPGTPAVSADTGLNEGLVAKAACIRDICVERPHQHGADMLAPLSAMLNECGSEADTVPACLALEGLVALCEAEVVDIRTVWAVLAPKLSHDSRPQVIRRMCELFSLVPSLAVNSEAYETFKQQTLGSLWGSAGSADSVIASAAYQALSAFTRSDFTIDLLPTKVTEEFLQSDDTTDGAEEPQEVPGVCFTRLLETAAEDTLQAYGSFLTSLVGEEVANLPRGIYHSALSHSTRPTKDRAMAAIPDYILQRYERNKQPGFRASLAAGLLFSFDPPVESGRDGRVRRQALVSRGRTFHQTLYSLLNEVSLQPTDWHCCMSLPRAWVVFMDRCYHAYLQNRSAELSLALDQGQVNDTEEHELLVATAWLWCRDKLTDLIKSASRGGPSVQANCVLALAGLALTTTQYASGLDEAATAAAKEATEHLGHKHWLTITTNTLMGLLDPAHPPKGRVFSICQQHPGQSLSAASMLARGGAALGLPLLVPILLTANSELIQQAITALGNQLPGRTQNPSLAFTHGLGLGTLVGRLVEEQYTDVGGPQGKSALWKALLDLEDAGLSEQDNRHGCLLGLASCLPTLCKDGRAETRAYVLALQDKLTTTIESLDQKDMAYTMVSLCVAVLAVSSYVTGLLSMDPVNRLVAVVYDAHCKDVCDGGLAAALGGMCHGLATAGHPTVDQLSTKLQDTWVHCLQNQELSTLHRLCALQGLLSLAGADASLFLAGEEVTERGSVQLAIKAIMDTVTATDDPALNITAGWRLGQLYMEAGSKATGNAAVPSSYQYLPETSILRPVVDRLLQAGKAGDLSSGQLKVLLGCLVDGLARPLPPLNWTAVLSSVLRLAMGDEVHRLCVKLTVRQAASAPSAALLLASAMLPPQWNNLHDACKTVILDNLGTIVKSVPPVKLREFLSKSFLGLFTDGTPALRTQACKGLCAALKVPDPPQSVTLALYQVLEQLYHAVPNEPGLYGLVGDCLWEAPDHLVDSITRDDFTDGTAFIRASFTRCYLVAQGSQPLAWLNPAVEMAMWECDRTLLYNSEPKGALLALVLHGFHQYKLSQSEATSTAKLSQWLLELMGHVRSVANGKVEPPEGASLSQKTVEFGLLVWAAVLVVTSDVGAAVLLPLVPMAAYHPEDSQSEYLTQSVMALLPYSLSNLQGMEQWKKLNPKILDWLVSMHGVAVLDGSDWKNHIKACVRALRHTVDFRKMAVWGPAVML